MITKLIFKTDHKNEFKILYNKSNIDSSLFQLDLKIDTIGEQIFSFYPISYKISIPFCFSLIVTPQIVISKNKNVSVIKLEDNLYLVKIIEKIIEKSTIFDKKMIFSDDLYTIKISNNILSINSKTSNFKKKLEFCLYNVTVSKHKNLLLITAFDINEKQYYIFHNPLIKNSLKIFVGDYIKISNNNLQLVNNCGDSLAHCKVESYDIRDNSFLFQSKYLAYENIKPKMPTSNSKTLLAFMECIQLGNYKLAKKFLSYSLSQKLTVNILKSFFDSFQEIVTSEVDSNNVYLIKDNTTRKIRAVFDGNFISNISEE